MKKLALIALALVVALGGLGVGHALWFDYLYVDGYVYTGYIGVEWSIEDWWDDEDKDFSSISPWIIDDTLYIDIYNAYPCVTYTVMFDLHCTGTVPVHFTTPYMWGDLPPGEITFMVYDQAGVLIPLDQLQLHPGETVYGYLTVHLNNEAIQDYWYWFYIDFMYHQYNEDPI
jgi:hypothetical protein